MSLTRVNIQTYVGIHRYTAGHSAQQWFCWKTGLMVRDINPHGAPPTAEEVLHRREHNVLLGRSLQKRCGATLAKRKEARMQKRSHMGLTSFEHKYKHGHGHGHGHKHKPPADDSLCILTPENTQGPYHVLGELVRQNVTQGQLGVPLELDVDFIDIDSCEVVPNVWVDGWSCNAVGIYSGYEAESAMANSGRPDAPGVPPPKSEYPFPKSMGPYAGVDTPDSTVAHLIHPPSDNDNFLRGVWQADSDGHLTMYSIVPGWYTGRSAHLHIKVYTEGNGSVADNGTFIAGSAVHTGQFFFKDCLMDRVAKVAPYNTNRVERLSNNDDIWFEFQNVDGYTAEMDVALVDETDITAGVIASIAVGLNLSYSSPEIVKEWWTGNSEFSAPLTVA